MGIGAGLYMCDVVVKSSRSLSHLLMSSCSSVVDQWLSKSNCKQCNFTKENKEQKFISC